VRARRAAELARNGLVLRSPLGDLQLAVKAIERVEQSFDVVILSCKSYDLEGATAAIAPAAGPSTLVLPLLNGLRHFEALDARFGPRRVLGGCCHIGVTVTADGAIEHLNGIARFIYGPRAKEQEARCDALLVELSRGGFAPVLSFDIERELWEKLAFLTAYAGLTCLMRASIGAVAAELLDECGAVAATSGFPLRPEFIAQSHAAVTERGSAGTSSMLRGGGTEHDQILGDMLTRVLISALN
jgi:2-dehydropantoate 2-reductase